MAKKNSNLELFHLEITSQLLLHQKIRDINQVKCCPKKKESSKYLGKEILIYKLRSG